MNILRRLSGSWGAALATPDDPPHHRLRRHSKNYDVDPLGGNRPISVDFATKRMSIGSADHERPRRRRHHHHHRERPKERHHYHRERSLSQSTSSSRSSQEVTRPLTHKVGAIEMTASPSSSENPSSPIITFQGGLKRRGTDGSETSVPYITATPPTPSPLERARRRSMDPAMWEQTRWRMDPLFEPPYPVTPPGSEAREEGGYIAYHPPAPLEIHPALHPGPRRARANTTPSASALEGTPTLATIPARSSTFPHAPPTTTANHRPRTPGPNGDPHLLLLRRFTTALLIDDSTSMAPLWSSTLSALSHVLATALLYTPAIQIHFLNSHVTRQITDSSQLHALFAEVTPRGSTPTGRALHNILFPYLEAYTINPQIKPLNLLVMTDGEATDDVEKPIVEAARRLQEIDAPGWQVGVQFLQVGDDEDARASLEELDDELANYWGVRDMVDTTWYGGEVGGEVVMKALLGGISRRWDSR